jgi:hypothetical protein
MLRITGYIYILMQKYIFVVRLCGYMLLCDAITLSEQRLNTDSKGVASEQWILKRKRQKAEFVPLNKCAV